MSYLRKLAPPLLFLGLGLLLLYGHPLLLALTSAINHAPALPVGPIGPNASSEEVVAAQQASGWPPLGALTAKLLAAAGAFVFMNMLRWINRQLTHPAPTAWAKKYYSTDFDALPVLEKFGVYRGIADADKWMAVGALIFGAVFTP